MTTALAAAAMLVFGWVAAAAVVAVPLCRAMRQHQQGSPR